MINNYKAVSTNINSSTNIYTNQLRTLLHNGLPGPLAHGIMAPSNRDEIIMLNADQGKARQSSVMIILYPNSSGGINTIFTKRAEYKGVHSGQIAFPGGKTEPGDPSLLHTALRETQEEIGVNIPENEILGKLTDLFVPPSNFIISPYVAFLPAAPATCADSCEVAEIFSVPVADFLCPEAAIQQTCLTALGDHIPVPGYKFENHFIWGATAMIFSELLWVIKQTHL